MRLAAASRFPNIRTLRFHKLRGRTSFDDFHQSNRFSYCRAESWPRAERKTFLSGRGRCHPPGSDLFVRARQQEERSCCGRRVDRCAGARCKVGRYRCHRHRLGWRGHIGGGGPDSPRRGRSSRHLCRSPTPVDREFLRRGCLTTIAKPSPQASFDCSGYKTSSGSRRARLEASGKEKSYLSGARRAAITLLFWLCRQIILEG